MEKEIVLNVAIRKEREGGYSVICTDLDVASQGETIDEAVENVQEAVELYIESAEELGMKSEVFDKLGIEEKEFESGKTLTPKIYRTEIPIRLSN